MSTPFLKHGYICIDKKKYRIIAVKQITSSPTFITACFQKSNVKRDVEYLRF